MTWPAPIEIRNPGMTSFANRARSRIVIPKIVRDRRGRPGTRPARQAQRSRRWSVRDGRSSVSRRTVTSPATGSIVMITRMIR